MNRAIKLAFWTAPIFLLPFFSLSAFTIAPSNITTDTTWTKSGSPYFIYSPPLIIAEGATLNIDPGVVVKFNSRAYMIVNGTLNAQGTSQDKIYFTAYTDDISGDTNGDGNATLPERRYWMGISGPQTSTIDLTNAVIRYSGSQRNIGEPFQPAIYSNGGNVNFKSVVISDNYDGIIANGATVNVNDSIFTNSEFSSINIFDNVDSQGIISTAKAYISNSSFSKNGFGIFARTSIPVQLANNWWGDPSGPLHSSNLNGLGDYINIFGLPEGYAEPVFRPWLTADPFATTTTGITKPVIIIPGILGSSRKNGVWRIDPIFHVYDNLIETLEVNGYVKDQTLFTFPYDWRNSNNDTAALLKQKIDEIKNTICVCDQVDIVAHSMGGLVARAYAQSNNYENDIDHLIFLGAPHRGAPKDYLAWEAGEIIGDIDAIVLRYTLKGDAKKSGYIGDNALFNYVRGWPITSIKELLPTYDYLRSATTSQLLTYPFGYPQNNFLENLNIGMVSLLSSNIDVTNVIGSSGTNTISTIRIQDSTQLPLWENGYPEGYDSSSGDRGLELAIGDGTVPEFSGKIGSPFDLEISSKHIELPTEAEEEIYTELTGETVGTTIKKSIPLRILFSRIFSPADIVMIAPDGKKVGKDFSTGQEVNGIDGAFYSGFLTDDEYITIPNPIDGEYKVQVQGTGSGGQYTLATGYFDEEKSSEDEIVAYTEPNLIQEINLEVNSAEDNPLETTPEDTTSPVISIISPTSTDYLRSSILPIAVDISDNDTGIASSTIKFDDNEIPNNTQVDLFFKNLGNHSLNAFAFDMFNNTATSSVLFRIITTPDSTISDINRAYFLGWIFDKKTRDKLIDAVKKIKKGKNVDKKAAKALNKNLKLYTKDKTNTQAYNLIKEDLEWMINN